MTYLFLGLISGAIIGFLVAGLCYGCKERDENDEGEILSEKDREYRIGYHQGREDAIDDYVKKLKKIYSADDDTSYPLFDSIAKELKEKK